MPIQNVRWEKAGSILETPQTNTRTLSLTTIPLLDGAFPEVLPPIEASGNFWEFEIQVSSSSPGPIVLHVWTKFRGTQSDAMIELAPGGSYHRKIGGFETLNSIKDRASVLAVTTTDGLRIEVEREQSEALGSPDGEFKIYVTGVEVEYD